ncbi:DUF4870 domain-containing protein [Rossellomorea vietnamensis]|uniref:DUF4870 domain-containing protein n=1 Tax=Rossellomorea vietnamensis TaxID=218284 RepID=A0A5D4MBN2_9BACI|nr:DUF4870 domain-containing protein [Bacillus sp. P14.5]TYR98837.1 DUF4870 domain-containing protein [Rossellomorea vietnamensis]
METNRLLSSLSYFSIFFAGFIFPIIVYFLSDQPETKRHAKSAFLSHLVPLIAMPLVVAGVFFDIGLLSAGNGIPVFMFIAIGFSLLISLIVVIWNVYKGIKVLL